MADVWDFGPKDPTQCWVLLALANHCNDDGESCHPSVSRIAHMCRLSERSVQYALAKLKKDEWITSDDKGGRGIPSTYRVNLDALQPNKGRNCVHPLQRKRVQSATQKGAICDTKGCKTRQPYKEEPSLTINEPSPLPPKGGSEPISKPTMPENADTLVFEIAKLYPRLSHLRIETELNHHVAGLILDAIAKDGPDLVRRGTKAYADSLDKPKFAVRPADFFGEFQYRIHAGNGKPALVSAGDSFLRRNGCL